MAQFENEEAMLQAMVESIEGGTGIVLDTAHVKELLLEVQREQLKGLVYRAFMSVNQSAEAASAVNPLDPTGE
jgi:hypothetical protein